MFCVQCAFNTDSTSKVVSVILSSGAFLILYTLPKDRHTHVGFVMEMNLFFHLIEVNNSIE